jgi:hypothetical protein
MDRYKIYLRTPPYPTLLVTGLFLGKLDIGDRISVKGDVAKVVSYIDGGFVVERLSLEDKRDDKINKIINE